VDTPKGPAWRRYESDRYGEHADGRPYDGDGIGRAWPLLTGERAHYELAAGHRDVAEALLHTMEAFANEGGLLPEQIWDAPERPQRELCLGSASGSAMPLCWAHAEYLKLCRSLREGRIFDQPPQATQRYAVGKQRSPHALWCFNQKIAAMPAGKTLRISVLAPAVVHYSDDGWRTPRDAETRDTGLSVHIVDLPTADLLAGAVLELTFFWKQSGTWEGRNFAVLVE
jgi:glucoamylase